MFSDVNFKCREGNTTEEVIDALNKLGYTLADATTLDVASIYKEIYGIDVLKIKELKFEGSMSKQN